MFEEMRELLVDLRPSHMFEEGSECTCYSSLAKVSSVIFASYREFFQRKTVPAAATRLTSKIASLAGNLEFCLLYCIFT